MKTPFDRLKNNIGNGRNGRGFIRGLFHNDHQPLPLALDRVTLVDTHVHTRFSDGTATVSDVEEACLAQDIGCCITDHNEIRGAMKLVERQKVPTLAALEMGSKEQIEMILFFRLPQACEEYFKTQIEPFRTRRYYAFLPRSLDYLLASAIEHDVLISIPHPYAPLWKNVEYGKKRKPIVSRAIYTADCIEVCNGGISSRANQRALKLCERLGRIPLGGSDSHDVRSIGSVVVAFNQPVNSDDMFDAMLNDGIYGILGTDGRPKYLSNAWHLAMDHSRKFILKTDKQPEKIWPRKTRSKRRRLSAMM